MSQNNWYSLRAQTNLPWATPEHYLPPADQCSLLSLGGTITHNAGKQLPDYFLPLIRQWLLLNRRHESPFCTLGTGTVWEDPVPLEPTPAPLPPMNSPFSSQSTSHWLSALADFHRCSHNALYVRFNADAQASRKCLQCDIIVCLWFWEEHTEYIIACF